MRSVSSSVDVEVHLIKSYNFFVIFLETLKRTFRG